MRCVEAGPVFKECTGVGSSVKHNIAAINTNLQLLPCYVAAA